MLVNKRQTAILLRYTMWILFFNDTENDLEVCLNGHFSICSNVHAMEKKNTNAQ